MLCFANMKVEARFKSSLHPSKGVPHAVFYISEGNLGISMSAIAMNDEHLHLLNIGHSVKLKIFENLTKPALRQRPY